MKMPQMQKSHKEHSKCKLAKPRVKISSLSKHQHPLSVAMLRTLLPDATLESRPQADCTHTNMEDCVHRGSRRIAGKLAAPGQNGLTELK